MKRIEFKTLEQATASAIAQSLDDIPTSVYETAEKTFFVSYRDGEEGTMIGTWLNGKPIAYGGVNPSPAASSACPQTCPER